MMIDPTNAHNMQMLVTALVVQSTDIVLIDGTEYLVADYADGMQYVIGGQMDGTYDDRNDAIYQVMGGAAYAFCILPNVNYGDDAFDMLVFSTVPRTFTVLRGSSDYKMEDNDTAHGSSWR